MNRNGTRCVDLLTENISHLKPPISDRSPIIISFAKPSTFCGSSTKRMLSKTQNYGAAASPTRICKELNVLKRSARVSVVLFSNLNVGYVKGHNDNQSSYVQ